MSRPIGCEHGRGTVASDTQPRHRPHGARLQVLVGKERFSEKHAWSEMPQHWPSGLPAAP